MVKSDQELTDGLFFQKIETRPFYNFTEEELFQSKCLKTSDTTRKTLKFLLRNIYIVYRDVKIKKMPSRCIVNCKNLELLK